jgi:SsrA-binding protein
MPTYAKNKKGLFNYEILETFEAGLVLTGAEVKSVRKGNVSMKGGYASIQNGEVVLKNVHISKYEPAGPQPSYEPTRTRKLLLNKSEIRSLIGKLKQKGLTLIPVSLYSKGRRIKLELALGRGKTKVDKRETIKKRDANRKAQRVMREAIK